MSRRNILSLQRSPRISHHIPPSPRISQDIPWGELPGRPPLRVTLVDTPDSGDPEPHNQLAGAASEQQDVVAVADVEAVHDGPPL